MYARRTRSFSVARMGFSNSARLNKLDFTTDTIGSVHMTASVRNCCSSQLDTIIEMTYLGV